MLQELQEHVQQYFGATIYDYQSVNGGDISQAYLLETSSGALFLKYHAAPFAPDLFAAESRGVQILQASGSIKTPQVIGQGYLEQGSYLLMEYIPTGQASPDFWQNFGHALGRLHQHSQAHFGLDHPNFIGSLAQSNKAHSDWPDFYISERLNPQITLARNRNLINKQTVKDFDRLFLRLTELCPAEPPALIHGDLWNGNFLVDVQGAPVLIDPSVAYAHREMDLAMTKLFGGFSETFYKAYEEIRPLEKGFSNRIEIYQLYYLMVHVNIFGTSYVPAVKKILASF